MTLAHLLEAEEGGVHVLELQPRLPADPLRPLLHEDPGQDGVAPRHLLRHDEVRADDLHHGVIRQDPGSLLSCDL